MKFDQLEINQLHAQIELKNEALRVMGEQIAALRAKAAGREWPRPRVYFDPWVNAWMMTCPLGGKALLSSASEANDAARAHMLSDHHPGPTLTAEAAELPRGEGKRFSNEGTDR